MAREIINIAACYQVFLVIGFICVQAAVAEPDVSCLDGWTQLHRGCYKFITEETTWTEAFDKCKEDSADLIVILSESEKDQVLPYLSTTHTDIPSWWVGLTREETSGTNWKWLDGTTVQEKIIPWTNSRVATRAGEVAGTLEIKNGKLSISTASRSSTKSYICEFHSITPRPVTNTTMDLAIQDGVTTPIEDNTGVQEPSEPSTGGGRSESSSVSTTGGLDRKETAISSASGKLPNKKPIVSTTDPTTSTIASTTTTTTTSTTTSTTTTTTTATNTVSSKLTESEDLSRGNESSGTGLTRTPPPPTTTATTTSTNTPTTSTTTPTPTTSTTPTPTTSTTTPTPPRTTSTQPTRPAPIPSPTAMRWDEAYKPYEGCYVPGSGSSLMQIVLSAQQFYNESSRNCPSAQVASLQWPKTAAGQTASVTCQSGNGLAKLTCTQRSSNIACWNGSPDVNDCASKKLKKLLKFVETETPSANATQTVAPPTAEETINASSELLALTRSENTTMEDVIVTSMVMSRMTERVNHVNKQQIDTIVDNVLKVGSSLVSKKNSEVWENMAPDDKVRSASTLMVAMESASLSMVNEINEPRVIVKKEENIDLKLEVVDVLKTNTQEMVYESDTDYTTMSIPRETLLNFSQGSLTKAVFITHYSMSSLLGGSAQKKLKYPGKPDDNGVDKKNTVNTDDDGTQRSEKQVESGPQIASFILSASLGNDGHIRKLPKPITFTMKLTQEMKHDQIALCSFWNNTSGENVGFWSQDGCQIVKSQSNMSHTTCQCDHMTSFAILLDVHGLKLDPVHQSLLNLVTIIGCVISCTALLASWVTFQCFSSLQGERNSIHKNLVASLLVAEIIFVAGIDQYDQKVLCSVIAGFLHYFFLAAFTWMFLEGLHIIFMLVQVFDSSRSRLPYYYFTGYGVPLIVVSASCLFYYEGYGTEHYCWLKHDRYFIWAFAGPVAIILLVNALFLAYAMSTVCRHSEYVFSSKDKTTGSGIRAWIQGALALEILLGLTWTLGYFFISDASIPMAYIFSIANSLQGLFIFVFHCLLNKKAQKEYSSVVHSVVSRSSSSIGTHSTLTKRSHQHSHEMNQSHHQRLTNTNSHSMA